MTDEREKNDLRRRAEKKVRKAAPDTSDLTHEDALNLVHELQVHQVELEIQNEELNRAREDLSRARDRYRDLYDFAPVGYLTLSKHNIIREANITVCQMLGVKRKDLLKRRLTEFIAPESQDEFYRHRRDILRAGSKQTCEIIIRCSDGGSFWAATDCARDSDGLRLTINDISSRKRSEEALKDSEERYRLIVETAQEGILIGATDGVITWANQRMADMLGYPLEEIIGRVGLDFMEPSQEPLVLQSRKELSQGSKLSHEYQFRRKDGTTLWTLATTTPRFDAEGRHVANFAMHADITEMKKSGQMKDEFIGMVSHEIKTPLTVVIGALSTANLKELPPEQVKDFIEDALIYSDILNDIVDNLLELSRAQSDRLSLEKASADIREVIGRIVGMLEKRAQGHNLVIDIQEGIPRVTVDRTRVERIILNLADNAIKYSPQGGDIRIFVEQRDSGLLVGVSDQGIGISKEDQARLFQRFERLDFHNGGAIQGIGLGLVVCRVLVEAHGGKIWVESKPGRGSTFYFTLPVEQVENSNL